MDLMNKELLTLSIDVETNPVYSFKQEQKFVEALNKFVSDGCEETSSKLLLPGRKLKFCEVQEILKQRTTEKGYNESLLKVVCDEKKALMKKVEDILEQINISAGTSDPPKLVLRNQRLWSNCIYDLDRVTLKAFNDAKKTTIVYSNTSDRTRFNAIVFVLSKVHELLGKNLTVTRRELFYQNVARFRNQSNLDVGVRDVCCLLESPPWNLGIVATAKGLVAGPLIMRCRDGSTMDCMTAGGTLLPQDINGIQEFKSTAKYILVVEKDAIFQKLLDEGALIRLGPVIILTGKGYPDVCTRQLLCRLVKELRVKALALVDHDPHGYEIFLTYKYGSLAQSHLSSSLACSSLLLLGTRHSDVMTLVSNEARLVLTSLDKRKLASLIKRPYLDTPVGSCIKEELQAMLRSGVKAEIEAVAPTAAALCDSYIPSKIIQADFLG
ncbi:meiotic recombination protein W68 [Epargyreus clarus]|uniref:meiotic recombination protein W68 n=1 Tax=Epargyreus clarus TaxID=520877 RepID=UPI003C2D60B6